MNNEEIQELLSHAYNQGWIDAKNTIAEAIKTLAKYDNKFEELATALDGIVLVEDDL